MHFKFVTLVDNKIAVRFKSYIMILLIGYIVWIIYNQMKDNFDIFFRRKPALMLVALKRMSRARYGSILAKEVDCTYSHAVKILQNLERLGLVGFEKKGRIKLIKLTKKGLEIAENIDSIKRLIG